MDERFVLMEDDKGKLVDEILELRRRNKDLAAENEKLRQQVDDLRKKPAAKVPDKKPDFLKVSHGPGLPPHQWGRKGGHKGVTRAKPTEVHREVIQTLSTCPDCCHPLGGSVGTTEHLQEDIVPAHVEVTRFLHHRYWCSGCKAVVTAPQAPDEVPYGYIGPKALATMVWMKHHLALPGNKIKAVLSDFCGLAVTEGAIHKALQRLALHLGLEAAQVRLAVQKAPAKHADETGWTVNGVGHWLWSFVTRRFAYITVDKSRGSKVPIAVLGHPFTGVLVSDFFSAYNKMSGQKQKCLVHLQREIRKARDAFAQAPPGDFKEPDKRLKRLLADAQRLADHRTPMSRLLYARRVRRIKNRLFDFATAVYSHKFWQRLSARLLKHHQAMFTFLDVPGLPSDNNAAERSIKPHVIIRNRSFQNRTNKGAHAHSILGSILQSLLLQGRPVVQELAKAYPLHRQGIGKPILFTSTR
jgi:transposase